MIGGLAVPVGTLAELAAAARAFRAPTWRGTLSADHQASRCELQRWEGTDPETGDRWFMWQVHPWLLQQLLAMGLNEDDILNGAEIWFQAEQVAS